VDSVLLAMISLFFFLVVFVESGNWHSGLKKALLQQSAPQLPAAVLGTPYAVLVNGVTGTLHLTTSTNTAGFAGTLTLDSALTVSSSTLGTVTVACGVTTLNTWMAPILFNGVYFLGFQLPSASPHNLAFYAILNSVSYDINGFFLDYPNNWPMFPFDATFQGSQTPSLPSLGPWSSLKVSYAGDFVLPTSTSNEDTTPITQQQGVQTQSSTFTGVTQLHNATYLNFQRSNGETEIGLFRNGGQVIFGGYTVPTNNVPAPWHATLAISPAPASGAPFPFLGSFVGLAWGYPGNFTIYYDTNSQLQVTFTWAQYPLTSGSVVLNVPEQMTNVLGFYSHNGWKLTFLRTVAGLNQQWYMLFDNDGKGFRGHFIQGCCGFQNQNFPLEGTAQP